jgi:hypothetical protein
MASCGLGPLYASKKNELEKIRISIDVSYHGDAVIDIKDSINKVAIYPSYIYDGLERFLIAIVSLNKGMREVECAIYCEPTWEIISFKQINSDTIDLTVYAYNEWKERPLNDIIDRAEQEYQTKCSLKQLTNQALNAFYFLKNKYGIEKYKEMWGHDFPERKFLELQELIKEQKI